MLLFSTVLPIRDSFTPEDFIRLVIEWNQNSPHEENVIRGIEWDGRSRDVRFGDDRLWLEIQEYGERNIIAVRFEKTGTKGAVWDTDYVMNFDDMRMSIQLDRSFLAEALTVDPKFSTPHFITFLSNAGCLDDDGDLPTTREPIYIDKGNLGFLGGVVNGTARHQLPVVYISKTPDNSDPVDVMMLAGRLKGVAHVLVEKGRWLNNDIRVLCGDKNEYNGAVGIYFPNPVFKNKRFHPRAYEGADEILLDKIVCSVINYAIIQKVDPLYTWQGVNNAILRDRCVRRGSDLVEMERAKRMAEIAKDEAEREMERANKEKDEAERLVDSTDEEISELNRRIENLTRENERLVAENMGLRSKISGMDAKPLLYFGGEDEFFPGEIKDIVLSVLDDAANKRGKGRSSDVLADIVRSNDYQRLLEQRIKELKVEMKDYSKMTGAKRQFLEQLGFIIEDGGKHYRLTYYGDPRYNTTLSKSGSDNRAGLNATTTIIRTMM